MHQSLLCVWNQFGVFSDLGKGYPENSINAGMPSNSNHKIAGE